MNKSELEKGVTGEQVREACLAAGIRTVNHHDCSICGYMTQYLVRDGNLLFDPGCDCCGGGMPVPQPWSDAAGWINMQTRAGIKLRLAKAFGLVIEADELVEQAK